MERVSSTSISHSKTTLKELGAIERAYEDFIKAKITRTGVMFHHLTEFVDQGTPIITQEVVIESGDKLEDLQVSGSWSYFYRQLGRTVTCLEGTKRDKRKG